jgi:hypothetical protein
MENSVTNKSDITETRLYNYIDINRLLIAMSNNQEDYLVVDSITLDKVNITQTLSGILNYITQDEDELLPVVIPVNLGESELGVYTGNHWTGLVIIREEDTVHIYYQDSLGNKIPDMLFIIIQNLCEGINFQLHDLHVLQQENGYDCGPLTILNLDALARTGELPENIDENAIIEQRKMLKELQLQYPEQAYTEDEEEVEKEVDEDELVKYLDEVVPAFVTSLNEEQSNIFNGILRQYETLLDSRHKKELVGKDAIIKQVLNRGREVEYVFNKSDDQVKLLNRNIEEDDGLKSVISNADDVHKKVPLLITILGNMIAIPVSTLEREKPKRKEYKKELKQLIKQINDTQSSGEIMEQKTEWIIKRKELETKIRKSELEIGLAEKAISRALLKHNQKKDTDNKVPDSIKKLIGNESAKDLIESIARTYSTKEEIEKLEKEISVEGVSSDAKVAKETAIKNLKSTIEEKIYYLHQDIDNFLNLSNEREEEDDDLNEEEGVMYSKDIGTEDGGEESAQLIPVATNNGKGVALFLTEELRSNLPITTEAFSSNTNSSNLNGEGGDFFLTDRLSALEGLLSNLPTTEASDSVPVTGVMGEDAYPGVKSNSLV